MKVELHRVELPLEHAFTIARGTRSVQRSLIVDVEHEGVHGYGEATEHAYYGVTLDSLADSVENVRSLIETTSWQSAEEMWLKLHSKLTDDMFALSAIDGAVHDLSGKLAGRSTFDMLGLQWNDFPLSSYTIGIDTIESMVSKLRQRSGWSIFKIKLGGDDDIEIVKRLRYESSATFRVDANCSWNVDETVRNSHALKSLGVEFIEQPLSANAMNEEHRQVYEQSSLPIIADESCLVESDVESCNGLFHGINVKLSKCGGVTAGFRMLQRARELGMKTMIGCMVESTVGISAAAQLLPLLDYADLDGAELLTSDVADGVVVINGKVQLPNRFGNGVELFQAVRNGAC